VIKMVNLLDLQAQEARKNHRVQDDDWQLARMLPFKVDDEIERLHIYEAKLKHNRFDERDMRDFQRLLKKHHRVDTTQANVWEVSYELFGDDEQ